MLWPRRRHVGVVPLLLGVVHVGDHRLRLQWVHVLEVVRVSAIERGQDRSRNRSLECGESAARCRRVPPSQFARGVSNEDVLS